MKKKRIKDVLSMLLAATLIVSFFFGTGETVRGESVSAYWIRTESPVLFDISECL